MPKPLNVPNVTIKTRNGTVGVIGSGLKRFEPPFALEEIAQKAWDDFWDDIPSMLITSASQVVLLRWIDAVNKYTVAAREFDESPMIEGHKGTMVLNPMIRMMGTAFMVIRDCERQLGIGVMNATQLGLASTAEKARVDDLTKEYETDQPKPRRRRRPAGTDPRLDDDEL